LWPGCGHVQCGIRAMNDDYGGEPFFDFCLECEEEGEAQEVVAEVVVAEEVKTFHAVKAANPGMGFHSSTFQLNLSRVSSLKPTMGARSKAWCCLTRGSVCLTETYGNHQTHLTNQWSRKASTWTSVRP